MLPLRAAQPNHGFVDQGFVAVPLPSARRLDTGTRPRN
jgi:hypothetical protein